MKIHFFLFLLLLIHSKSEAQTDSIYTQSYLEKSTRFAWLTYGGDLNYQRGGHTQHVNNGSLQYSDLGHTIFPRLTIGGVHFWGHVDFYVSFPLSFLNIQQIPDGFIDLEIYQGVETGLRLYPFPIKANSIRPFAGISFRRFRFLQESSDSDYENGVPDYGRITFPYQFGLTYTTTNWHFTLSGYYNGRSSFRYYISPMQTAAVEINPLSVNLSFLRYIDTDKNMRSPGSATRVNRAHAFLQKKQLLSAWFWAIGPSATLQITKSPFLNKNYPYFYDSYSASILPDVAVGRYLSQPDLNLSLSYRTYGDRYEGFDENIRIRRHSVALESVKFLFNWLGFVPFVGPSLTYEDLMVNVNGTEYRENKLAVGILFGWDIRVTKTGTGLLRTNLRYYPNLHLSIDGEKMMFDHLEFNFIQWVQFIGRKKAYRQGY